jgi:voltage-gated potassium channel
MRSASIALQTLACYIFSFYGIIGLVSTLPTYIAFLFPSAAYLIVIRIMRVLRIFRILKLFRYMGEANLLYSALVQARRKILVFLFTVLTLIIIFGALMFIIEGPEMDSAQFLNQFTGP